MTSVCRRRTQRRLLSLLANVVMASPSEDFQSLHRSFVPATKQGTEVLIMESVKARTQQHQSQELKVVAITHAAEEPVTDILKNERVQGRSGHHERVHGMNDGHERFQGMDDSLDNLQGMDDPQPKQKRARVICTFVAIIVGVIVSLGLGVGGGIFYQTKSSGSKESSEKYIAYHSNTLYLAEVNERDYHISVQQLCYGGVGHTVELYLAPNCDLEPHCSNFSSEITTVKSTRNLTITEVDFNERYHIYMTSSSNITFTVEISTPMANTSLVIFDNYTYFSDFEHSDHPTTARALVIHTFKEQKSSYTFQGATNTYFAAFESLSDINFTFRYTGYICNYNHLDYMKSECDLPSSTCQQESCAIEYESQKKICLLGYVPPSTTYPSFAYLLVKTTQRITITKHNVFGIALLSVGIAVVFLVLSVCMWLLYRKLSKRPPCGYEPVKS